MKKNKLLALGLFITFLAGPLTSLEAQRRTAKKEDASVVGARLAYFSTTGELNENLPSGIGVQVYYDHPFSFFLSGKLPAYMPASLQAALNYEGLSGEVEREESGLKSEYSLSRVGLEAGPVWSFLLAPSQKLSLILLAGFASESSKREDSALNTGDVIDTEEKSGMSFSSHFLVNYEYHYGSMIFSAGSYTVYGADKETPLIGIGLNLGFGYRF